MSLAEFAGSAFSGIVAKVRRETLAIVVAAACAIGALYQGAGAAVLALEPYAGAPGARAIMAGLFVLIGAGAIAAPRIYDRLNASKRTHEETTRPRHLQMAAIFEAMAIGFSLSSKPRHKDK